MPRRTSRGPIVTRAEFDDRELRIIGALRDKDRRRRLAGVYQTALRALHTPADEGCESARISTICHCMRELMNCLPEAMADNFIRREKQSTGYWIEKLPKLVTKQPTRPGTTGLARSHGPR
jgi:hypothetical protein